MRGIRLAISFLTRLPVGHVAEPNEQDWENALLAFPLVGVIIGTLLTTTAVLLPELPGPVQAAVMLMAWVMITGIIHLDGLADSVDAACSGQVNPEELLRIQKDPHVGPAAVIALVLCLFLLFALLSVIVESELWGILIFVPVLSRLFAAILLAKTPYANPQGLGKLFAAHSDDKKLGILVTGIALLFLVSYGLGAVIVMLCLSGVYWWVRHWALLRFGGITGDHLGAGIIISELLIALILIGFETV